VRWRMSRCPLGPVRSGYPIRSPGSAKTKGNDVAQTHYRKPGWFTQNVFNKLVALLTRSGFSVLGSRVLEVKGRKSGLPRRTPVNLLVLDGQEYLVSPRGQTEWVRNARADDGRLDLLLGSKRRSYRGEELPDDARKVQVLRAYLKRWKAEVGVFFDGIGPDSTDEQIQAIAHKHPVFLLHAA
jgi:deazaflavin-dependent oxidoreductase (nitroreductase family)